MFPKKHRLPGNRIPYVLQKGKRVQSAIATLIDMPRKKDDLPTRISIIVPVRLSKKAVVRNRTRRLIREAVHTCISDLEPGTDAIIMSKITTDGEKLVSVQSNIIDLLKKGKLISSS